MVQAMREDSPFYMGMGTVDLGPVANAKAATDSAEMGLMAQLSSNRTQLDIAKMQSQEGFYRAETEREIQSRSLLDDTLLKNKMYDTDSEFRRTAYADWLEASKKLSDTDEARYQDGKFYKDKELEFEREKYRQSMLLWNQSIAESIRTGDRNYKSIDDAYNKLFDMLDNRKKAEEARTSVTTGAVEAVQNVPLQQAGEIASSFMDNEIQDLGLEGITSLEDLGSDPGQVYDKLREALTKGTVDPQAVRNVVASAKQLRDALQKSLQASGVDKKDLAAIDVVTTVQKSSQGRGFQMPSFFELSNPLGNMWYGVRKGLEKLGIDLSNEDLIDIAGGGEGYLGENQVDLMKGPREGRAISDKTGKSREDVRRLKALAPEVGGAVSAMNKLNLLVSALEMLQNSPNLPDASRKSLAMGLAEAEGRGFYSDMDGYAAVVRNPDFSLNTEAGSLFLKDRLYSPYREGNPYNLNSPAIKQSLGITQ